MALLRGLNTTGLVVVLAAVSLLEAGAAFSIHYRGGVSRGTNLPREINGTEGDLQLTASGGQVQIWEMDVRGGKAARSSLVPRARAVSVVAAARPGPFQQRRPGVRAFRPRLSRGNAFCPTFEDAVTRHRMLDAIETAAATGQRQTLG
jgi:predicted dehydrogenase